MWLLGGIYKSALFQLFSTGMHNRSRWKVALLIVELYVGDIKINMYLWNAKYSSICSIHINNINMIYILMFSPEIIIKSIKLEQSLLVIVIILIKYLWMLLIFIKIVLNVKHKYRKGFFERNFGFKRKRSICKFWNLYLNYSIRIYFIYDCAHP